MWIVIPKLSLLSALVNSIKLRCLVILLFHRMICNFNFEVKGIRMQSLIFVRFHFQNVFLTEWDQNQIEMLLGSVSE